MGRDRGHPSKPSPRECPLQSSPFSQKISLIYAKDYLDSTVEYANVALACSFSAISEKKSPPLLGWRRSAGEKGELADCEQRQCIFPVII